MSGVRMIQDNTETCLRNLERSLSRCNTFLQHRCIPRECALATKVPHPAPGQSHTPSGGSRCACKHAMPDLLQTVVACARLSCLLTCCGFLHFCLIDMSICEHLWFCGVIVLRKGVPGALCGCMQEMLQEFSRELQALKQREERIVKLCLKQQATLNLKNREFTEAVVHLIQQCLR